MVDAIYKVRIAWETPLGETMTLTFDGTVVRAYEEFYDLTNRGRRHINLYLDGKLWRTSEYDNGLRMALCESCGSATFGMFSVTGDDGARVPFCSVVCQQSAAVVS